MTVKTPDKINSLLKFMVQINDIIVFVVMTFQLVHFMRFFKCKIHKEKVRVFWDKWVKQNPRWMPKNKI